MTDTPVSPDVEAIQDLREYVTDLRTKKGQIVDMLEDPPLHHPACDDVHGRFQWWQISEKDGDKGLKVIGYFHTQKGVQL